MVDFGIWHCDFVRIALTPEQVRDNVDVRGRPLDDLAIEVKTGDKRANKFIEEYGDHCWEADILPASGIEETIDEHIRSWFDAKLWKRRDTEIERARALL